MKKSDEYLIDTIKNMSVGLIVSAFVALQGGQQMIGYWIPAIVSIIMAACVVVYYYHLKAKEKK